MSDESESISPSSLPDPWRTWWLHCLQPLNEMTAQLISRREHASAEKLRETLDHLSGQLESYLRSPEFLQLLKFSLDSLIAARAAGADLSATGLDSLDGASSAPAAAATAEVPPELELRMRELQAWMQQHLRDPRNDSDDAPSSAPGA